MVQQIGARQQVRIVATFTDGKTRDVTAEAFVDSGNTDVAKTDGGGLIETLRRGEAPLLARYEGNYAATTLTVMGDRSGFVWQSPEVWGHIDELVAAKWERMRIQPSGLCSDSDFLRRVYLDLTGLPPERRGFAGISRRFASPAGKARRRRGPAHRIAGVYRILDEQVVRYAGGELEVPRRRGRGELQEMDSRAGRRKHPVRRFRERDPDRQRIKQGSSRGQLLEDPARTGGSNGEHDASFPRDPL